MSTNMMASEEIAPREYEDLFDFLIKGSGLFKTTLWIFHKHKETKEKPQYGTRYYEREHQAKILELFEQNDFEGILAIPPGKWGECATQLVTRYVESGAAVGFQIEEARPHEEGRYVGLTPAKVFLNDEGKRYVERARKVDQEMIWLDDDDDED